MRSQQTPWNLICFPHPRLHLLLFSGWSFFSCADHHYEMQGHHQTWKIGSLLNLGLAKQTSNHPNDTGHVDGCPVQKRLLDFALHEYATDRLVNRYTAGTMKSNWDTTWGQSLWAHLGGTQWCWWSTGPTKNWRRLISSEQWQTDSPTRSNPQ